MTIQPEAAQTLEGDTVSCCGAEAHAINRMGEPLRLKTIAGLLLEIACLKQEVNRLRERLGLEPLQ